MGEYLPPTWSVWEFDPPARFGHGERWVPGWQGAVGVLAEQVTLGWRRGGVQVVVSTASFEYDPDRLSRRAGALFLVLGGSQLDVAARPAGESEKHAQLAALPADDVLWRPAMVDVDGLQVEAEVLVYADDVVAGYFTTDESTTVGFAVAGLGVVDFAVRRLSAAAATEYATNPLRSNDSRE